MALYKQEGSPFWHYDLRHAGKRYRGSTKQTSKTKARTVEIALLNQLNGVVQTAAANQTMYLHDFAPRFLAFVNQSELRPKTQEYYANGWRLLEMTDLGHMRMDQICDEAVNAAVFAGSGSNANCALRTLRRMLHFAHAKDVITRVPAFSLRKESQRELTIDPGSEIKLLAKANSTLRDALTLMLDTGMRPSEVVAIAWEHVDFVAGNIFIPTGKTSNARRYVPLTSRAKQVLVRRAAMDSQWVFASTRRGGEHIGTLTITSAFRQLRDSLGLDPRLVLYSSRHTFATDYIESTGNLAKLMRQMGHSSISVTQRYMHPDTSDTGAIMDARNQRRSNQIGGIVQ